MGYYIEVPAHQGKDRQLEALYGAQRFSGTYDDLPEGKALVCVVKNGLFDAAAVVYDKDEYEAFNEPDDSRPKSWLTLPREKVIELCPDVKDRLT